MTDKHLHIVTHDVPWPADYGGVIDLFYKIKELYTHGIKIHLHCFTQRKYPPQNELHTYCASIHYYPRKKNILSFSFNIPFIVNSRRSKALLKNLLKDNYPILLEGIHCTYFLYKGKLSNRLIQVRLHNVEYEYYKHLAKYENHFLKKIYFTTESRLLKKYEATIASQNNFIAVSSFDKEVYKKILHAKHIYYLPVFLPWEQINIAEGTGNFCLYHGNLSINENEQAVLWILQYVFNDLKIPLIIAGKNPSKKLERIIQSYQHVRLISNPGNNEMMELIRKAQIHILPSFNNTGIKLKLLFALFNGRHCIVNTAGVTGSGLENICHIADDPVTYKKKLQDLYTTVFTNEESKKRQLVLEKIYNNKIGAQKIIDLFWPSFK